MAAIIPVEKARAMLRLMCALNEGRQSGEDEGYVSSEDVRAFFAEGVHESACLIFKSRKLRNG